MNTITVKELNASQTPYALEMQSLEGAIYLAFATNRSARAAIVSDRQPLKFHSLGAAKDALGHLPWSQSSLVQQSPYDEMIGHDHQPNAAIGIPLNW